MAKPLLTPTDATEGSPLAIDLSRLEKEWLNQPLLVYRYNEKLANLRLKLDRARGESDVTEANLDRVLRRENEALKKPLTETAIKTAIRLKPPYQEAQEAILDLKHSVDVCQAMCIALEHRKRALENLVSLHGQQYFAKPTTKTTGDYEAMEESTKNELRRRGKERDNDE